MEPRSDLEWIGAYHSWSRGKLLELYDRLPWKVLLRNRESSFGSIRNVHLHILQVYASWLVPMFHRTSLKPLLRTLEPKNFDRVTSVDQQRRLDRTVDRQFLSVSRRAIPARMGRKHWFTHKGSRFAFTEGEGLWHMVEEDFLHRGEILCMLWQDDIEPPNTSYMLWKYETDPKGHAYLPYHASARKPTKAGTGTRLASPSKRSRTRATA
jgi:uncharacterized damage-inducible protein DinB